MKNILYGFLGALFFGGSCIGLTWLAGVLFGPLYQGEAESTRNFKIFLTALLISIIVGAISGYLYSKKNKSN